MYKPVQYQIAILGAGAEIYKEIVTTTLMRRLRELGLDVERAVKFLDSKSILARDLRAPIVCVYFGDSSDPRRDEIAISSLCDSSVMILPVVQRITEYSESVPDRLLPINGLPIDATDPNLEAVSGRLLEMLSLLRRSRRLFISYRRVESSAVASQLYNLLDEKGFDVFLDTHSVVPGDPFQDTLWHRLADTDVVILLDTPGFAGSQWTREELANASAMSIGILQLIWPGSKPSETSDLCIRRYLRPSDFRKGRIALRSSILDHIAITVESLRARSFAARYNNLVREFCDAADRVNVKTSIQTDRHIVAELVNGSKVAVIPAVGVPDATRYEEVSSRYPEGPDSGISSTLLIYDHRGIRDIWMRHLAWLDMHLPVRSVRITDVGAKLKSLP